MLTLMLAYTTRGEGSRAVIMLHGFLGSGRNLGLIARRWSVRDPRIRIVLPDLTGHGTSPALPPGADLGTLARDVLDLATSLALQEPFELVGHSLGGRVSLMAGMIAPERIQSTVLLDSTPARIDARRSTVVDVLNAVLAAPDAAESREAISGSLSASGLSAGLVDWLMMNVVSDNGVYRWRIDRLALKALLEANRKTELWGAIRGRKVRLIWGEQSTFVAPEDVERLQDEGADVVKIAGAGHYLHVEKPEAVLEAILR